MSVMSDLSIHLMRELERFRNELVNYDELKDRNVNQIFLINSLSTKLESCRKELSDANYQLEKLREYYSGLIANRDKKIRELKKLQRQQKETKRKKS